MADESQDKLRENAREIRSEIVDSAEKIRQGEILHRRQLWALPETRLLLSAKKQPEFERERAAMHNAGRAQLEHPLFVAESFGG